MNFFHFFRELPGSWLKACIVFLFVMDRGAGKKAVKPGVDEEGEEGGGAGGEEEEGGGRTARRRRVQDERKEMPVILPIA